jgi:hypothetical protein
MDDKNKIALLYEEVKKKILVNKTTPDNLQFDGLSLDWSEGSFTFSFFGEDLNKIAYSEYKTHPFVFNALKGASAKIEEGSSAAELKRHFKDYDVKLAENPSDKDITSFISKGQWNQDMGQTRLNTKSGRIWKRVLSKSLKQKVDVIVFWCAEEDISKNDLKILQGTFNLKNVLYCANNSHYFNEYHRKTEVAQSNQEKRVFKSKLFPQLTHFDIVRILLKAHTDASELTNIEKKVVNEFRGEVDSETNLYGGFASKAEYEYRKKVSESSKQGSKFC